MKAKVKKSRHNTPSSDTEQIHSNVHGGRKSEFPSMSADEISDGQVFTSEDPAQEGETMCVDTSQSCQRIKQHPWRSEKKKTLRWDRSPPHKSEFKGSL